VNLKQSFNTWLDRIAAPAARDIALAAGERVSLTEGPLRITLDQAPLELRLGDARLLVIAEARADDIGSDHGSSLLLVDHEALASGIYPFERLGPGGRFELDPDNGSHQALFGHPRYELRNRLQLHHEGRTVWLNERTSQGNATVARAVGDAAGPLTGARHLAMEVVAQLFPDLSGPLPPASAMQVITSVNELLAADPDFALTCNGDRGSMLRLPRGVTPIFLGDLHGRVENLLTVLSQNAYLEAVERGTAAIIILGDMVHPEVEDRVDDMTSSMMTMDLVLMLKRRFPRGVHMLLGNHDSFSPELIKGGVLQGLAWSEALVAARGERYRDAMKELYQRLPYIAVSDGFAACHAGPPKGSYDRDALVALRTRSDLVYEIIWNRPVARNRPNGYTSRDVNRFRKVLGLAQNAPFVTAHHPRSADGTVWTDVDDVKGHHVVFSSRPDTVGVIAQIGGRMVPQVYPVEPLSSFTADGSPDSANSRGRPPGSVRT
jgi:hypothetical protein